MPETTCVVPNCSRKGKHKIPKDRSRRDAWIHAIRRGKDKFEMWEPPSQFSYLCESHFTEDDYESVTYSGTKRQKKTLKKTAVPSIFSWTNMENIKISKERKARREARTNSKRQLFQDMGNTLPNPEVYFTDLNSVDLGACEIVNEKEPLDLTSECNDKGREKTYMETETQTPNCPMFSIYNFEKDSAGLHFYTGLETYSKFWFVLDILGPAAYCLHYAYHSVTNISVPNQFFLVMMKLRRHTTNFELSRMFGIAESVVPNVFLTWIIFMERQWKEINIWPEQELVRHFVPLGIKRDFPKTRLIVDGTEFPIKKPKNPRAQQATFSTYKNRNTVKILVGTTPGGLISYVSPAYGGSASDRQIVERSNLCSMCDPGDSIMADKGFNVQDLFAPHDVHINIPTFFKKRNRMSNKTVIQDRKVSSKRVHIERIIGLAKTFRILREPMTATETKLASEISFVCFMLCNFKNCIIPDTS